MTKKLLIAELLCLTNNPYYPFNKHEINQILILIKCRKPSHCFYIPWSAFGYLDADHKPYSSFTNKILKLKKSPPPQSRALKWRAAFCSVLTEAGWCNAVRLHQMSYWDRKTASVGRALKQALRPRQGFEEAITKRSKKTTAFIQHWKSKTQCAYWKMCTIC